jgi:hypothetical protein
MLRKARRYTSSSRLKNNKPFLGIQAKQLVGKSEVRQSGGQVDFKNSETTPIHVPSTAPVQYKMDNTRLVKQEKQALFAKINVKDGGDYFNADGSWNKEMSEQYNGADYHIFILSVDGKSKRLLTEMPLDTSSEREVVEKVIRNYALQIGIKYEKGNYRKGSGLVNLKKSPDGTPSNQIPANGKTPAKAGNPAFTIGKDISINYTGGKIHSSLSNYHNLKSVLYHEWQHKIEYNKDLKDDSISDNKKGTQDGIEHLNIYLSQMEEPGFKHTTQEFKNGMATVGGTAFKGI